MALVGEDAVAADEGALRRVPAGERLAARREGRGAREEVVALVPGQHRGGAPRAVAAPVVRDVARDDAVVVVRERAQKRRQLPPAERPLRPQRLLAGERGAGLGRRLVGRLAAELGGVFGGPERLQDVLAVDEERAAVARPVRDVRRSPLDEEDGLRAPLAPVREPVAALLDGREIEVDVACVEAPEVAGGMVVDRPRRVRGFGDGAAPLAEAAPPDHPLHRRPEVRVALDLGDDVVADADAQRIHVARVAEAVVVHRVENHGRMPPRHPHGLPRELAEDALRLRVVAQLRLVEVVERGEREGAEQARVVAGGEESLRRREAAGTEVVVVRDDEVPAAREEVRGRLEARRVGAVGRVHRLADLRAQVDRDAVEDDVAARERHLAEPEAERKRLVEQRAALRRAQRERAGIEVLRRVHVPERGVHRAVRSGRERSTFEPAFLLAAPRHEGGEDVARARCVLRQAREVGDERDLAALHRRLDRRIGDAGAGGHRFQPHRAREAAVAEVDLAQLGEEIFLIAGRDDHSRAIAEVQTDALQGRGGSAQDGSCRNNRHQFCEVVLVSEDAEHRHLERRAINRIFDGIEQIKHWHSHNAHRNQHSPAALSSDNGKAAHQ